MSSHEENRYIAFTQLRGTYFDMIAAKSWAEVLRATYLYCWHMDRYYETFGEQYVDTKGDIKRKESA